ncbi:MAG: hypothetical protein ACRECH_12720 [Nitrososphaerales archaeon]
MTPSGNRSGASAIFKEFYDYAEKDAKDYVDTLVGEAKNVGVSSVSGEVPRAHSSPAVAITDMAK